jgi:tape measure domain-containing protein
VSVVANVAINVDSRNAVSKLREVQAQAATTERAFNGVAAAAGKLAIAFGALQAFKFVFAKTAELESQTRSLEVLTGSAQKAGQIIKELQQLGAVTPFTSTELIDSAKRLQAFGVEADKVVETTRRLADVSGATGAELSGLVTAYGQVQAKGRLQGEELLQFQERGVALQAELRKMYGLSGDEFQKALSKGRVSAEAVEVAIIRLTNTGGKYANGAIAQSDTLQGKFSTLQDSIQTLAQTIGKTLTPVIKSLMDQATDAIAELQRMFEEVNNIGGSRERELQYARNADAAVRAMNLNPFTQQGMMYEMRQRNIEQQRADYELRRRSAAAQTARPAAGTPATPALLASTEKEKRGRELNINDLLGGEIQRQLQAAQAKLAEATAKMMNTAAASENPQQAQRMVEYTSKLLSIKYQIAAADDTINKREGFRAQLIASAADKAQAALAFDEGTNDLKAARRNLETEINTLLTEQAGKAEEQYRQQQQSMSEALMGLDMELLKVQAITDVEKNALRLLEIENTLKKQGITLTELDATAIRKKITEISNQTKAQQEAKDKAELAQQQFTAIGSTIGNQLTGAFDNLINKTQEWNDVLRSSLAAIGKVLMMAGLNMLAGADGEGFLNFLGFGNGLGARAAGGPVAGGSPYLVGEKGPELFVPGTGGSVVPTNDLRSAMSSGGSPVLNMSFQSTNIGGVEYVSRDQLEAAMAATRRDASRDGARRGMSMTLDKLQQSPGTRSRVGLR